MFDLLLQLRLLDFVPDDRDCLRILCLNKYIRQYYYDKFRCKQYHYLTRENSKKLTKVSVNKRNLRHWLPNSHKHVNFIDDVSSDYILFMTMFSPPTQVVKFPQSFNVPIGPLINCAHLHTITFGDQFNQTIEVLSHLEALQTVTFGDRFDQHIDALAKCKSLKSVTFGGLFRQPIDSLATAPVLECLTFGDYFNRPVYALACISSLQHITFGWSFDQSIAALAHLSALRTVSFGKGFAQPIIPLSECKTLQRLAFIYTDYDVELLKEFATKRPDVTIFEKELSR